MGPTNQEELSESTNPYGKFIDLSLIPRLRNIAKAYYKNYRFLRFFGYAPKDSHHNTIATKIGGERGHGAAILGAILTQENWDKNLKGIIRVSVLTSGEEEGINYTKDAEHPTIHIPLFDHSIVDATTGRNITFEKFSKKVKEIAATSKIPVENKDNIQQYRSIYFHCMAGKSRSPIVLTAYLYLTDNTSYQNKFPSQIINEIKQIRPQVNSFRGFGSNLLGFLGLVTLRKEANNESKPSVSAIQAQNIGLVLHASLDCAFRDAKDLEEQKKAFIKMHDIYAKEKRNLLAEMLIPLSQEEEKDYRKNFDALSPNAKMHFAILAQTLKHPKLPETCNTPELCAKEALRNSKKLSAGDLVEFLRTFGSSNSFNRDTITGICKLAAKKIASGTKIDRHRGGTQLAELCNIIESKSLLSQNNSRDNQDHLIVLIESTLYKLSYPEQVTFVVKLQNEEPDAAREFAKRIIKNYERRWFAFFYNPLEENQLKKLQETANPNLIFEPTIKQPIPQLKKSDELQKSLHHEKKKNTQDETRPHLPTYPIQRKK